MDVKYFLMQAALERTGRAEQLQAFLRQALDNCLYDIPKDAADLDRGIGISEVRAMLAGVRSHLSEEIQRIASKLSKNEESQWRTMCAFTGGIDVSGWLLSRKQNSTAANGQI